MASDSNYNLERQLAMTEAKLEIFNARLEALQKEAEKADSSSEDLEKELDLLKQKIYDLEKGINDIKAEIQTISKNVFLQFTKDIDLKKLVTILLILSTAFTSPTLLTSWLDIGNGEDERLERLVDLLENNSDE